MVAQVPNYGRQARKNPKYQESHTQELSRKYENMRWSLAETSSRYDDLVEQEKRIRILFDLPEFGISGLNTGGGNVLVGQLLGRQQILLQIVSNAITNQPLRGVQVQEQNPLAGA